MNFSRVDNSESLLHQYSYNLSYPIYKGLGLQFRLTRKEYLSGNSSNDNTFFLGLTWSSKSNKHHLRSSVTSNKNSTRSYVSLRGKVPKLSDEGSSNYALSVQDDENSIEYSSSLSYNTNAFTSSISYDREKDNNATSESGRITYSTALAFVNTHMTQTLPISNSFLFIDNKAKLDKPLGLYGFSSKKARSVHGFPSFSIRQTKVNQTDLPFNLRLKQSEFNIVSAYKAGIYVPLEVYKRVILRLYLKDDEAKSVGRQTVSIIRDSTQEVVETFSNKKGRVAFSDAIMAESYTVKTNGYTYKIDLAKLKNKSKRLYNFKNLMPVVN